MSKGWQGGSTREWRRIREAVLLRDRYLCQLALPGCTHTAPLRGGHVHHVKGKARGDSMDHLIASCRSCNLRLGDPTKGARNPIHKTVTKW